jgi:hypothetical protein
MFTPTTALRLLATPLESDYRNTLWFPNRETQTAYFLGRTIKTYDNFQYIKKNNTIVVDGEVDLLYNCNYIMYQNNNFTNKWFYAFIDRIEWASNSSVRLYVSTDVIQTWFFDITYYDSYVDRCHSDTDVAGDNIVPEDFSVGNPGGYQVAGSTDLAPDGIALFATATYAGESRTGSVNSGIYSGGQNLVDFHIDNPGVGSILDSYVKNGTATAVIKLQQYPYKLKNGPMAVSFSKYPSSISGYTPKNNKMLSSAFVTCFMSMYGQETDFNPVFITDSKVNIKISADQTSGTISAFVENYSDGSISTISMFASIPESGWGYNQYKNDYNLHSGSNAMYVQRSVAQRAADYVSAGTNTAASVLDTAGNIFRTGVNLVGAAAAPALGFSRALENIGSTAKSFDEANQALTALNSFAGGYDSISQDLATISENYNAPATGGMSASNGYIATGKTVFSYGYKVLPRDIVERCDKFLTVYGYKQSEYRAINLHARASWTYIKTNGLNASGNFPDDDMNIIKRAFNSGIFFWVYTATYGNFGQNNAIV